MLFAYIEKAIGAQPVWLMNLKIKANLLHLFMFISKATGNLIVAILLYLLPFRGDGSIGLILPGKYLSV